MNDIKDKFPQNVRTSINRYRDYYYRILIYRMSNIFKCSYKESIKSVSQKIKVFGRKFFIQKSCEFFEVDYDDSLYIKDLKLRELTRTLKVLPTPKEIIKQRNEKRIQTNIERYGYKTAFSLKETQDKVKKTFNEKYGGNTPMKDDKVKQKVKDTTFQRYGVTNCMNLEHVDHNYNYENIKKTVKEKYGVANVFQLEEVKEKIKNTNLEKYGVECFTQTSEYKEKSKDTCLEKYGVDNYSKTDEYKEKVKQTSLEKYGVENFNQKHFKNLEDLNEEFFRNTFIKDERFLVEECSLYFNFSYSAAVVYKEKFNITELNKSSHLRTQQFIYDSINVENKIFNDRHLEKELDIYTPDYNLAIEYDGLMYHSEGNSEHNMFKNKDKNYHLQKTELCLENNIQLLHIFEGEDLDLWLSMINNKLNLNEKIYARKCIIKELNSQDTIEFLNENHLQGFCRAKINVGLFYNNELVSLMTFSKPRFNKNYEYELIRFCSKRNTSVIGGATKLWKYFVTKYNPNSVITYANRRFSNGEIYKTLGFTFLEKTSPNYFYFKPNEFILYSRVMFQKHKLKDILEIYDENLSESENMFNNNYRRIYDCGNLKFIYNKNLNKL